MTHSALTNQIRQSNQRSSRNGTRVDTFLIHHQAGTSDDWTINAMVTGSKQVSANYTISNEGRLTLVVDEDYRAWTSGSSSDGGRGAQWDRRSITVEIENESAGGDWPISNAAFQTAINLLADLRKRYQISNVLGHRDLYQMFQASYPTYCPGPNTVARINGGSATAGGGGNSTPSLPGANVNYGYGLTSAAQKDVQGALSRMGRYTGIIDGAFGALSVKAFQQLLRDAGLLARDYVVDGIPGTNYGKAVQNLASKHGYKGPIDGALGAATSAGISAWAKTIGGNTPSAPAAPSGKDWSYWEPTGALAKRVQAALKGMGRYAGPVDGVFGPATRKGVQQTIAKVGYGGPIDGVIGRDGSYYIQVYAAKFGDYHGPVDRAPREGSWAGLALGLERK